MYMYMYSVHIHVCTYIYVWLPVIALNYMWLLMVCIEAWQKLYPECIEFVYNSLYHCVLGYGECAVYTVECTVVKCDTSNYNLHYSLHYSATLVLNPVSLIL